MHSFEANDAPANFEHILAEVEDGEIVDVTRDGVPVARIVPIIHHDFEKAAAAIDD